uniref:Uncharacterized protein n=1 Tax=Oryza brachyantha TaxID=4533 RepID=J3M7H9_ORYBR
METLSIYPEIEHGNNNVYASWLALSLITTSSRGSGINMRTHHVIDRSSSQDHYTNTTHIYDGSIVSGIVDRSKGEESDMGRKTGAAGAGREEPAVVVAIRMDKTTIIVSSVVGSLGVLSAILGFAAEAAKLGDCASALGLAVTASIFLMMAQVTVAAAGGCCGCCKSRAMPSEAKRIVGVVCAAISWYARSR